MSYSRADQTLELPTTRAFASAQPRQRTRRPSRAPRLLVAGLFLAYLVLLTWLIVWKLEVPFVGWGETRHLKLMPFVASEGTRPADPSRCSPTWPCSCRSVSARVSCGA